MQECNLMIFTRHNLDNYPECENKRKFYMFFRWSGCMGTGIMLLLSENLN